jgi:hypothetical protein
MGEAVEIEAERSSVVATIQGGFGAACLRSQTDLGEDGRLRVQRV